MDYSINGNLKKLVLAKISQLIKEHFFCEANKSYLELDIEIAQKIFNRLIV